MSPQGLKRLQQIAFLFAMETGVCFYGYSGNRSLAVVSPFQLLELLNPSGWDKRKEVCRHFLRKKTSGLRRSRTQAGKCSPVCSAWSIFIKEVARCSPATWEIPLLVRMGSQVPAACPSPTPPSSKGEPVLMVRCGWPSPTSNTPSSFWAYRHNKRTFFMNKGVRDLKM